MSRSRLYSDFNCPFCYAMHERLHALGLMERLSWQGVQHAPHLRRPMAPWSGHLGAELKQEVAMVRRLAPDLAITLPRGKPNTAPAIAAAARALQIDPLRAQAFIRSLYRLFWLEGLDLSEETVLQQEAERHGLAPALVSDASAASVDHLLRSWEEQWHETEHDGVPLLERSDNAVLVGLMPADSLRSFLAGR